MPDTCKPRPPLTFGAPSNLAFLRRLQLGSCSIPPPDRPILSSDKLMALGIKQLSLPPAPIIVGAMADITGDGLPAPAAL
jgi:hypothetical protein